MKERIRAKIKTIYMEPDDSIILKVDGEVVLEDTIKRTMVLDEAVIFDVEPGDFKGAVDGIGGAFLVTEEVQTDGD